MNGYYDKHTIVIDQWWIRRNYVFVISADDINYQYITTHPLVTCVSGKISNRRTVLGMTDGNCT